MNPKMMWALAALSVVGLAGCLEQTTVLNVNKSGAGTVVITSYMSKTAVDMMAQLDRKKESAKKNPLLQEPARYKASADAMGTKFVGVKELSRPDGSIGVEETYSFTDVTRVKLNSEAKMNAPGTEGRAEKKSEPITFAFAKGPTAKLTIKQPEKKVAAAPEKADKPTEAATAQQEAAFAQMKQIFEGFRLRVLVKVDGEIAKTNATYVGTDEAKKPAVTLLDLNVGELLKDDAQLKKLSAMGKIDDVATAREKLKDFPGIKAELSQQVDVEFK
ncbi:MAG: hypothetical protein QM765_26255 [Myxococcales bacterium]